MVKRQLLVLFLWLTTIMCPYAALGAQGDVTIAFGGLCPQIVFPVASGPPYYLFPPGGSLNCTSGGTTYFRIVDRVPGLTLPNDPNRAQIVPASVGSNTDSIDDTLRFYNFKIYAVTPTPSDMPQGYQITFWREHTVQNTTDGPGTGPGTPLPDRWFKTSVTGTMKRVINNWIKMAPGYVTNPVGSPEKAFGTAKTYTVTAVTCPGAPPSCALTNLVTSGKWIDTSNASTWLTGNRVLRLRLSFKLQNGNANPTDANSDWILVDTGAKLNDQTHADPGDQDECSEQYTKCRSCWWDIFLTSSWRDKKALAQAETYKSAKIDLFTKVNWASLQEDIVRGGGEHLTSLATLLDVSIEKQDEFFSFAQDQYRAQAEEGVVRPLEILSRLQEEIARRPMLFAGTMGPTP